MNDNDARNLFLTRLEDLKRACLLFAELYPKEKRLYIWTHKGEVDIKVGTGILDAETPNYPPPTGDTQPV